MAKELNKATLPDYRIEPPDILTIDAVRIVPLPPYKVEPLDALFIQVTGTDPGEPPINGVAPVDPDGTVNLGATYGQVKLIGLTLEDAGKAIEQHLSKTGLTKTKALVTLAQSRGVQQIRGEHLVRQDGVISLGAYGQVYVTGMTLPEAKFAIERQLAKYLSDPSVVVDILGYNSKVYYVVSDGAGYGQQILRLPITGNEDVLDAISQIGGLPTTASKRNIWIARPAPRDGNCPKGKCGDCAAQILPVDWNAIVQCGDPTTNYQIFPGDRLYIKSDGLITFNNTLAKIIAPLETISGFGLLVDSTVLRLGNKRGGVNGNNAGTGNTNTGF
jgi:polysaccharide export outer membrane protein